MIFDGTITLGNILEVVVITGGWVAIITSLKTRLKAVEDNQKIHSLKLDNLSKINEMQARFDERMSSVRRDVDDLRRGKGFIQTSINGEYEAK